MKGFDARDGHRGRDVGARIFGRMVDRELGNFIELSAKEVGGRVVSDVAPEMGFGLIDPQVPELGEEVKEEIARLIW